MRNKYLRQNSSSTCSITSARKQK
uniref:Uncharacterized protein n=1 Tax=Anguilla anguilla TaxID=7936 RepID=A0A0E9W2N2_ANGAN